MTAYDIQQPGAYQGQFKPVIFLVYANAFFSIPVVSSGSLCGLLRGI